MPKNESGYRLVVGPDADGNFIEVGPGEEYDQPSAPSHAPVEDDSAEKSDPDPGESSDDGEQDDGGSEDQQHDHDQPPGDQSPGHEADASEDTSTEGDPS